MVQNQEAASTARGQVVQDQNTHGRLMHQEGGYDPAWQNPSRNIIPPSLSISLFVENVIDLDPHVLVTVSGVGETRCFLSNLKDQCYARAAKHAEWMICSTIGALEYFRSLGQVNAEYNGCVSGYYVSVAGWKRSSYNLHVRPEFFYENIGCPIA
ncbi:OLC1v1006361C1 [Oldenlandia corymbosa var. corymbosa]|uniref:OLC1v1006361C1 n=1 Tax=Oldenlandia corymbosa var. corymbosa TaxID=529605 RepID=A0AAV1DJC8_OLDCO|nr:OLC1v1006361C1 [Oldenlandia corymbosa var. corymbosa]